MVKASAIIFILLLLFCSLACKARVIRLTSPDPTTDEIVHKDEKHQQPKRLRRPDPHTIEEHLKFYEPYEPIPYFAMIHKVEASLTRMRRH